MRCSVLFFFFQAEDGIRDLIVTGVQTCALPISNDIGMHESTVSRATAGKYVHTPQGTFELKYFFTSSLRGGQGSEVSAESVKEKIREIIAKEDAKKPLSDQYIAEMLGKEQIDIARRTVAKYRELMGILPSSKRKQVY